MEIKILNVIRHIKITERVPPDSEVSADMKFLLEITTNQDRSVFARISDCSLKLLLNGEEKIDTRLWLPLEKAGVKGSIGRYGASVSATDLIAGLESYFKKDYGARIDLADIISTAWIRFPEEELQPGHSWSNSLQRFSPEKLITIYMLSGIERYKDTDCAIIASSSEQKGFAVPISPIAEKKEMDYQLTEKGTIYWAHQFGALVEGKTDVAIEASIIKQFREDVKVPIARSELKINLVIERVGPDRRYSSPENTLRELIDAINKKDKERYYACLAKDQQQWSQEFPEAKDFLNSYFRMPGKLMIGYTIPGYEIVEFSVPSLQVKQIVKFDYSGETKEEIGFYNFWREGDQWLLEPFPSIDIVYVEPEQALHPLIQAINKRDPLLWFQCMASPVHNRIAKMNPSELQDYFNNQFSEFPFQITDYHDSFAESVDIDPAEYPETTEIPGLARKFDVFWYKGTLPDKKEIAGGMKVTMVRENRGWRVLDLEKLEEKIDLAISPRDIFLTKSEKYDRLIAVKIHNNSYLRVPNVDARFFLGDPEEGGTLIGQGGLAVEPGRSAVEAIPWDVEDGEYEVFVIIDPENQIAEANEDNNKASKIVRVDSKE